MLVGLLVGPVIYTPCVLSSGTKIGFPWSIVPNRFPALCLLEAINLNFGLPLDISWENSLNIKVPNPAEVLIWYPLVLLPSFPHYTFATVFSLFHFPLCIRLDYSLQLSPHWPSSWAPEHISFHILWQLPLLPASGDRLLPFTSLGG
jgi:hypothetical protein